MPLKSTLAANICAAGCPESGADAMPGCHLKMLPYAHSASDTWTKTHGLIPPRSASCEHCQCHNGGHNLLEPKNISLFVAQLSPQGSTTQPQYVKNQCSNCQASSHNSLIVQESHQQHQTVTTGQSRRPRQSSGTAALTYLQCIIDATYRAMHRPHRDHTCMHTALNRALHRSAVHTLHPTPACHHPHAP